MMAFRIDPSHGRASSGVAWQTLQRPLFKEGRPVTDRPGASVHLPAYERRYVQLRDLASRPRPLHGPVERDDLSFLCYDSFRSRDTL